MGERLSRRKFFGLIGLAPVMLPLAAAAPAEAVTVIGIDGAAIDDLCHVFTIDDGVVYCRLSVEQICRAYFGEVAR